MNMTVNKEGSSVSWCSPDVVYLNGNVITVDPHDSIATALATKGDRIVAVGSDDDMKDLTGKSATVVDLGGKTVLPGINDCHLHGATYGLSRPPFVLDVGYPAVSSIRDLRERLRARAAESKPGEWIRGIGWDEGFLEECLADPSRHITREDLDAAAPDNPVYLVDFTQHALVANSRALELAGITRDTHTGPGSEVVKDPAGEPTGLLRELPAQDLLMNVVPLWSRQEKRDGLVELMRQLNSRGITSFTDAAVGPGGAGVHGGVLDSECISIYNDLLNEGGLTCRVNLLYLVGKHSAMSLGDFEKALPSMGFHSGFGNEWLRLGGLKLFGDGIPQTKTAFMHEEYSGGGNGVLMGPGATDKERYDDLISTIVFAHRQGFQCGIHVVGGRAIEASIDGFVRAQQEQPRDLRHYLIHCDFISETDVARAAKYDIGVCPQPILKWTFSDVMDRTVGVDASEREFPLRTLLDAGVHVSGSSDAPVTEPDWLQGVESAVLRKSKASGTIRGPRERITVAEAIRMFTMGSAWQDHMDHLKGSIEPGKLADLCVLDRDILSVPPEEIHTMKNLATIVGGRVVFDGGLS